ncbi:RP-L36 [Lepeophtheirus salmonis]|uniref:39S ribosomal protein L36, mitochondrial n=1 Tax=Lepeophtheirus salmonis TaxID=72036 RepID=A0A7R8CF17_LEPSM|nr:RP-L36 [Lepeophtheirus salmonis]CAF2802305.1 RP-L36 [Lepeophtheirus salmonis]
MTSILGGLLSNSIHKAFSLSQCLLLNQVRGLKFVQFPKKRCPDCYFVFSENRKEVFCTAHPRHRQSTPVLPKKMTYIMTSATQGRSTRQGNTRMLTQSNFRLDF